MERQPKARWVLRDDLPDGEVLLPVVTDDGTTVMAARAGHMSEALLAALNESLDHLIGTGVWHPGRGLSKTDGTPKIRDDRTSPAAPKAWWDLRDDLPEGHVLIPVLTRRGTCMAARTGHMSDDLLKALNSYLDHLIGTGMWQPGAGGPHEGKQN